MSVIEILAQAEMSQHNIYNQSMGYVGQSSKEIVSKVVCDEDMSEIPDWE